MISLNGSSILEKSLILEQNKKKSKSCLFWGTVNVVLLSIILYDITHTCPFYVTYVQYLEYCLCIIFLLNILYHFTRYFFLRAKIESESQLLKLTNNVQKSAEKSLSSFVNASKDMSGNKMSWTPLNSSWNASSQNQSCACHNHTFSYGEPSHFHHASTPKNISPRMVVPKDISSSGVDVISDENSLSQYLKEYENYEKFANLSNIKEQSTNLLSSFWNHPTSKASKDVSPFLRRNLYQTATRSPISPSGSPSTKPDSEKNSMSRVLLQGMEMWKRLGVDMTALTLWNENLRLWISKTILERLVQEFTTINDSLAKHGFGDVQVGNVGLDRLRKTAELTHVKHFIPSLSTLIPFLEVTPNQEYLVKRVKELAKGGCMSDFTWNGGSSFNEKEWDHSLPTDSAIIMHLFATYMDTQLMPLPNNPDAKPFSSYHFIKSPDSLPTLKSDTLAIQAVTDKPPHYRVIVGEEVFELQGHNNLLYSILFFLFQVNKREHGMLGRVNLGKAGLNMLWIIQS